MKTTALLSLLAAGGAAMVASHGPSSSTFDLARVRMVDLTHPFDDKTPYWPTATTGFELKTVSKGRTPGGWFYSAYSFCAPEHGGTHLDAPVHFAEAGRTADQVPLAQLSAPGVVIDVSAKAAADPDYRLTVADVRAWEGAHGAVPAGSIVLLRTGWSARWPDRKRYLGDDTPGDASHLHFPSYGKEAAEMLVRDRKAGVLGIDTASIDYGASTDFAVHQVAAAANVPGLENLDRLEEVPATGAWIVALPMKIGGGSGGPLRAVALIKPTARKVK
jgi:kynurenine formamidase